jgi:hypothetical protein
VLYFKSWGQSLCGVAGGFTEAALAYETDEQNNPQAHYPPGQNNPCYPFLILLEELPSTVFSFMLTRGPQS